jgi:hypothetical protein
MGKKVESYQSDDGKLFKTEEAMLLHEAQSALTEEFPTLKINVPFIMENAERISALLEPLASYYRKNHPAATPETTLSRTTAMQRAGLLVDPDSEDDDYGCDCGALLSGNAGSDHLISCPAHPENQRARQLMRGRPVPFDTSVSYRDGGVNEPEVKSIG